MSTKIGGIKRVQSCLVNPDPLVSYNYPPDCKISGLIILSHPNPRTRHLSKSPIDLACNHREMGEKACFWSVLTWLDYPFRVGHLIRPAHTQFLTIYPVLTEIQVLAIDILTKYSSHIQIPCDNVDIFTVTYRGRRLVQNARALRQSPAHQHSASAIYPIRDDAAFSQCISGQ